jgi:hypothetical protein
MTEVSAIAPNKGSSGVESGSVPMHSDPNAVEWSLIDRKQLQLIIQAYDLLVSYCATGEGGLSPEVTSRADFVGGPFFYSARSDCCHLSGYFWRGTGAFKLGSVPSTS